MKLTELFEVELTCRLQSPKNNKSITSEAVNAGCKLSFFIR